MLWLRCRDEYHERVRTVLKAECTVYSGCVKSNTNEWNSIALRIQAIAQTGLAYATSPYDAERYHELSAIAASMIAGPEPEKIALAAELFAVQHGYATPRVDVRAAVFIGIACFWFASGPTGCGHCPAGGPRSGRAPPNLSNEKCVRNPATS